MTESRYPWHSDIEAYTETINDIVFCERKDAENVVNGLLKIVSIYGYATMANYLELCGNGSSLHRKYSEIRLPVEEKERAGRFEESPVVSESFD